jgi:hypothetical protein
VSNTHTRTYAPPNTTTYIHTDTCTCIHVQTHAPTLKCYPKLPQSQGLSLSSWKLPSLWIWACPAGNSLFRKMLTLAGAERTSQAGALCPSIHFGLGAPPQPEHPVPKDERPGPPLSHQNPIPKLPETMACLSQPVSRIPTSLEGLVPAPNFCTGCFMPVPSGLGYLSRHSRAMTDESRVELSCSFFPWKESTGAQVGPQP